MECNTVEKRTQPGVRDDAHQVSVDAGRDLSVTDPDVQAALARVSATMMRALMRIEANARRRAAAESPPGAQKEAIGAPPPATAPVTTTTTITAQGSDLEDDHVG